MKNTVFLISLLFMLTGIVFQGCHPKDNNKPDDTKTMDELIVSNNFDWRTTKTIQVFITLPEEDPTQLVRLYAVDEDRIFYSGYGDKSNGILTTTITIPSRYNMIKLVYGINNRYKPILVGVDNDLVYDFNNFKTVEEIGCDLTGFKTFSQGGWSSPAHGSNPGAVRDAYFNEVFPNGLTAGDPNNFTIFLNSSSAVKSFLPGGGRSKILTQSYTNPYSRQRVGGNWAGQIVAAIMNTEYDRAGHMGSNTLKLGDLIFTSGPFEDMSVDDFLIIANKALGGGGLSGYTIDEIQAYAEIINLNFDGGQNLGYLTCPDNGGGGNDQCGCKQGLRTLTMEYNGQNPAVVEVKEKKHNVVIYSGNLVPGDQFSFHGSGSDNKMGNIIRFYVNSIKNSSMHTSCSVDIFIGDIYGDFTVVDGTSKDNLHLCERDPSNCGCDDDIRYLELRYDGVTTANIEVKKGNHTLFSGSVDPNNTFSFTGSGRHGRMGSKIKLYVDGNKNAIIITNCSQDIEVGDSFGDFTIMAGSSKNNLPLCGSASGGGGGDGGGGSTSDNLNGTLAYEDLWPGKGDYDFNDMIINYNFDITKDDQNQVQNITATFVLYAYGASYHNGFGFSFPNVTPDNIISASGYDVEQGGIFNITSKGVESGQSKATFIVFDDTWRIMPPLEPGIGVNTEPGKEYVDSVTIEMQIVFYENGSFGSGGPITYDQLDIGNFNPFLVVNGIREIEVHLPDHAPTDLADQSYFGTMDDNSIPADGRYYKTSNNLPWCINIPVLFEYPIEKQDITGAYLHFGEWAESDGQIYTDWYEDISGYRNSSLIYQKPSK